MRARAVWFAAMAAIAPLLAAADNPRSAPVSLRADRIDIDQRTGVSHYTGHVNLQQGATRITAARATARSRGDVLERVTAEGNPATFRDQLPGETQPVHGTALRLEYEAVAQRARLSRKVEIQHAGDTLRADAVDYDLTTRRAHAERAVEIQHAGDTLRAGVIDYDLTSRHVRAERDAQTRVYMAVVPRRPETPDDATPP